MYCAIVEALEKTCLLALYNYAKRFIGQFLLWKFLAAFSYTTPLLIEKAITTNNQPDFL